jgi:hypothetical protein
MQRRRKVEAGTKGPRPTAVGAAVAPPAPATRRMTVIAQDPSVLGEDGGILMAEISVPAEDLDPGPMGYRVHVVDYDATTGVYHGAHRLPEDVGHEPAAWKEGRAAILTDPTMHAQNVYALVMKTLARFEFALGRRIGWSFKTHQLNVAPHGMLDANAFYAPAEQGLVFGYFTGRRGQTVYTCLSHDVVVHEATHALIDGLRERYLDPSSPDQAAFHEGFADVVALLSVFSQKELVQTLLGRHQKGGGRDGLVARSSVTPEALRASALFGLAEEMGGEMQGVRGEALRRSLEIEPDETLLAQTEFLEPHRRGEVLVAAVMNAFVQAWAKRIETSGTEDQLRYPLSRVAEEGSDIADALATMWIRALDYMPPVHVTFGDALSAAITADMEVRIDDSRYALRDALMTQFERYGIGPASTCADPRGAWERAPEDVSYQRVRFESMRHNENEVFRFLWENRDTLNLQPGAHTRVLSVRPCQRIGVDGFTLRETVAEYYQVAQLTPAEMAKKGITAPPEYVLELQKSRASRRSATRPAAEDDSDDGVGDDTLGIATDADAATTPLYGGGTLIFDEYGRLKFHVHNNVFGKSQEARLDYLWRAGLLQPGAEKARLSPSRLSALHRRRAIGPPRRLAGAW